MNHTNKTAPLSPLLLAALGVVYGDIGTSPLYTLNAIFAGGSHPVALTAPNILGILSLIFWSLLFVVSFKYVAFIMRANNRGEGGIIALMALALRKVEDKGKTRAAVMLLGIAGAALFYGDGVITPAISVLSAVEGLHLASPVFKDYVIPIAVVVIVALFMFQRQGTGSVGKLFGPIMLAWFVILALLGILNIMSAPQVFWALNPLYGLAFLKSAPTIGFLALGGVVLALTGAEALYADMGHFGTHPIRIAWFSAVLPALVLNYFGQGALLMHNPGAIENPFYLLAPTWALYPLIVLATVATVIASQAVISGAFSMTRQAMQLGYSPRMEILYTSDQEAGQIYVPGINWALLVAVLAVVFGFRTSTNLGAAYGIAVTGTMLITSILAFVVVRRLWGWGWIRGGLLIVSLLIVDIAFFSANVIKVKEGGWFPLLFGFCVFVLMTTWKRGRFLLRQRLQQDALALEPFVNALGRSSPTRVPGTAVFFTASPEGVPQSLLHNLKHNKVLHDRIIVLTVRILDIPYVPIAEQLVHEALPYDFHRITAKFGFKDKVDIPKTLEIAQQYGLTLEPMDTTFFLGRETLIPKIDSDMPLWREKLFIFLYRNASSPVTFFKIPPNRVVELGTQVVL